MLPQSRLDGFVSTLVSVPARLVELHGAGQPVVAGLQVDGQERPTFFQKVGDFFARKFGVTARLWKTDQVCYSWLWWQSNVEVNASVLASDSFSHFEGVKWVLGRAVVVAQWKCSFTGNRSPGFDSQSQTLQLDFNWVVLGRKAILFLSRSMSHIFLSNF